MTKAELIPKDSAISILYSIGIKEFGRLKTKNVSGKDVFSALLPDDFDFVGETRDKKKVLTKRGKIIEGFIDKSTIGEDNGTLIRALYAQYGEAIGMRILNQIFRLGIEYLFKSLSENVAADIKEKVSYTEKKVEELIEDYKKGRLETMPGLTPERT